MEDGSNEHPIHGLKGIKLNLTSNPLTNSINSFAFSMESFIPFSKTKEDFLNVIKRQGPFKGFIGAGIIFGCIDCLVDGEPIASIPLDYLVGYGSAAIVGFTELVYKGKLDVKKYIVCGLFCLIATFVRLVGGTLSGMLLWETPFVESLVYNATYIVPTGLFALVGLLLLLKPNEQIGRPDR